jgi:hypothetical protein
MEQQPIILPWTLLTTTWDEEINSSNTAEIGLDGYVNITQ